MAPLPLGAGWGRDAVAMAEGVVYRVRVRRRRGRPVLFFQEGGVTVAAAGVRWEDMISRLERLGFRRENGDWVTGSSLSFLEALVYYGVGQTIRSLEKLGRLWGLLDDLELLELRFWGSKLSEGYQRAGRRGMYRPAKAFKILYGLA